MTHVPRQYLVCTALQTNLAAIAFHGVPLGQRRRDRQVSQSHVGETFLYYSCTRSITSDMLIFRKIISELLSQRRGTISITVNQYSSSNIQQSLKTNYLSDADKSIYRADQYGAPFSQRCGMSTVHETLMPSIGHKSALD